MSEEGFRDLQRTMVLTVTSERLANSAMMDYTKMEWNGMNATGQDTSSCSTAGGNRWIFALGVVNIL
jgi:hypothetical protein